MRHLIAVSLVSGLLAGGAVYAQQFSREVGEPMKAAKAESDKGRWDAALAKLKEADAVKTKSAYEQYQINELKAFVYFRQKKMAEVAALYEQNLQSGQMPANLRGQRLMILAQIHAGLRNHPKAIEFGNLWIQEGGGKDNPRPTSWWRSPTTSRRITGAPSRPCRDAIPGRAEDRQEAAGELADPAVEQLLRHEG